MNSFVGFIWIIYLEVKGQGPMPPSNEGRHIVLVWFFSSASASSASASSASASSASSASSAFSQRSLSRPELVCLSR
jgi:tRNA (Thr-GGU) A37 N-methylase